MERRLGGRVLGTGTVLLLPPPRIYLKVAMMNPVSAYKVSRVRWWLFAAVAVVVFGQALVSGHTHIHADTLDSADCYICKHGDDQGKKLPQAVPHPFVQPQRFSHYIVSPTAPIQRPLSAASIRAPPAPLPI